MKLRDVIIFIAGAEFFYTISLLALPHFVKFPIHLHSMVVTSKMNFYAVIVNAVITVLLLMWANGCKHRCKTESKV